MRVFIDGVQYVPVREVVVNRKQILRALVELFWGEGLTDKRIETESFYLRIRVSDDFQDNKMTVHDFVDSLAL